ncbi:hypothetical protein [Granulicoccus sp. GXG6511]|uniref:hypothetical protein n=1 Tax=Granulicoccus sp. GXG6511 TaxID=3381351 RepID=UPI003D7CDC74
MPRKVTLPGSSDPLRAAEIAGRAPVETSPSRGTGRVRHEEKITVYVSRAELLRLEQARLSLRAEHGLAVDRGRIVREAVAAALDEFDAEGSDADLLRRLAES